MTPKREILICEIPKSKSDLWRVSIRSFREGRLISIALFHRHGGNLIEVAGKAISVRPDRIGPLIQALECARSAAFSETVAATLGWIEDANKTRED